MCGYCACVFFCFVSAFVLYVSFVCAICFVVYQVLCFLLLRVFCVGLYVVWVFPCVFSIVSGFRCVYFSFGCVFPFVVSCGYAFLCVHFLLFVLLVWLCLF